MVWYFFCTFAYTMIKGISRFLDFFRIKLDIMPKNDYTIQVHREVEQLAARWAHNPKTRHQLLKKMKTCNTVIAHISRFDRFLKI